MLLACARRPGGTWVPGMPVIVIWGTGVGEEVLVVKSTVSESQKSRAWTEVNDSSPLLERWSLA